MPSVCPSSSISISVGAGPPLPSSPRQQGVQSNTCQLRSPKSKGSQKHHCEVHFCQHTKLPSLHAPLTLSQGSFLNCFLWSFLHMSISIKREEWENGRRKRRRKSRNKKGRKWGRKLMGILEGGFRVQLYQGPLKEHGLWGMIGAWYYTKSFCLSPKLSLRENVTNSKWTEIILC